MLLLLELLYLGIVGKLSHKIRSAQLSLKISKNNNFILVAKASISYQPSLPTWVDFHIWSQFHKNRIKHELKLEYVNTADRLVNHTVAVRLTTKYIYETSHAMCIETLLNALCKHHITIWCFFPPISIVRSPAVGKCCNIYFKSFNERCCFVGLFLVWFIMVYLSVLHQLVVTCILTFSSLLYVKALQWLLGCIYLTSKCTTCTSDYLNIFTKQNIRRGFVTSRFPWQHTAAIMVGKDAGITLVREFITI